MARLVIGSEALRSGALTRHQLQQRLRVLPDVYAERGSTPSLRERTVAAWLWSRRRAVVAGAAASALHGARWVDDATPVELIWDNGRPPRGLVVRNETLAADECTYIAGLPVTTLDRTAFDLGRHVPRATAVARLDALMHAKPFTTEAVLRLADRHPGARGVRRIRRLLPLVNGGAASPKETWLRLLIVDAGLPSPTTQIPIQERWGLVAILDMGWEEFKVAAEYDGDQHRTDRRQYVWDQRRSRLMASMGWKIVRVIKEDSPSEVISRIRGALWARGWRP